ncbi:TerC family protein [Ureibacillus chungkukjangi]|uniref:YkoY family integral membrane protein n=1 Tax=Ureibacillus chungkukjangi TaxID=1202712 RepID=A0A318TV05_9BACL|nr:TerC family protein [Ureibacillus chungkukjangi]PYF08494.1 YkoY family integral membrane protein [Ureibacillus chungkukjangi]
MDVINQILSTYAMFFDWEMWGEVLTDPVAWGLIGSLVVIEGLLSADNALVLAVLVKHLPEKQRKKALMYGMLGAYFFRFLFIGIGVYLIKFWFIKVLGALYLGWLVYSHFRKKGGEDEDEAKEFKKDTLLVRLFGTFWATVISVELMDIAFSVDSILAAFAISDQVWVLLLGGMLGIIMMRTVAGLFLTLIEKVPELENTAFVLIGIISLKMLASVFGFHLEHWLFFLILIVAFAATFVIHFMNKKKATDEENINL